MNKLISFILVLLCMLSANSFASGSGEGGELTVGLAIETFDDVFMQGLKDAAEQAATDLGVKLVVVDGKSNPAEQVKQIENFITTGVDAIAVHVINNDIAPTITQKAVDAGVPLVYVNRQPPDDALQGDNVVVVASPEIEAGRGQGEYVVNTLKERGISEGNVVVLLGGLGSAPQIGRTQGVKDYLAENAPGFKVIREQTASWKRPDAIAVIENWISSGDKFVAVFANNDEMALGASIAIREAGIRDQVLIVGVDANSDAVVAIEKGEMDMSMFQNGRAQGKGSIEAAVKMARGESVEKITSIPFEPVTKDNVSQYK